MSIPGFYIDNAARDYPLLAGTSFLPLPSLVSCGFIMGPRSGFDPDHHSIYLSEVRKGVGYFDFVFKTDAAALSGVELSFRHSAHAAGYETAYADAVGHEDDFTGFTVSGPLAALQTAMASVDSLFGTGLVEPALIQSLNSGVVSSVSVRNIRRGLYTTSSGCRPQHYPYDPVSHFYNVASSLTGIVRLYPGRNFAIDHSANDNSITLSAVLGEGEGENCAEESEYPGEVKPADSKFFSGGPACSEVIRSVGASSGKVLEFLGEGTGQVAYDPENHKIVVKLLPASSESCGTVDDIDETELPCAPAEPDPSPYACGDL